MLAVATIGFALNFWAWALLSPLAPKFKDALHLSPFQQSLLVAVPVIVGSVGRIPVGALTDRFGGRVMFPIVSLATVVPVLYLGPAGHSSLAGVLVGGFFLGIGGTAFAVGVPFVSAWFPPQRRGLAVGVFGMGMGGTAISALTTVKLVTAHGIATQHDEVANLIGSVRIARAAGDVAGIARLATLRPADWDAVEQVRSRVGTVLPAPGRSPIQGPRPWPGSGPLTCIYVANVYGQRARVARPPEGDHRGQPTRSAATPAGTPGGTGQRPDRRAGAYPPLLHQG
jgi:nitrate/nitrite transporter NarK